MPRLRRIDCCSPGIRRVRRGRGFSYIDPDGKRIRDRELLGRIRSLAIPPAWTDVWICPHPRGHIQATGHDDAGRKQYLYHEAWREHRDREKFEQMVAFGRVLPEVRRHLEEDVCRRGMVRPRVLACAIRLLDLGFFRIGGERYVDENDTYGLATLKRRHVSVQRGRAVFDYRAKGSQRHVQVVADPLILPTIRALKARGSAPGGFLAYRDGRGWRDLRSDDINERLRGLAGGDFSAKDFRTWNATVLAAVALAANESPPSTKAARQRAVNEAAKQVGMYLSDTPAVCRGSYIDPRVIDRFESGETIRRALDIASDRSDPGEFPDRERIERAVIRLID
jgi:DNA topoisomerase I